MFRLSCPSCNTSFTLPELPADRRAACPRCGDVFPIRTFTEEAAATPQVSPQSPATRRAFGRWSVARSLAVALTMGLVGLGVGLWVYHNRGGTPPRDEPEAPRPEAEVLPPTKLRGLGYLPADTNLAFAVQPGAVLQYAVKIGRDPREFILKTGIPAKVLDTVAELGLTLPQIDHLAGGTYIGNGNVELRLTLALVLRRPPADEDAFLARLKAKKQPGGKVRYDVELGSLPMAVERVAPTIWVFGLALGDDPKRNFEAVEKGGYGPGGGHFPAGLREMIATRVPPDSAAWFATNDESWADKPGVRLVLGELMKRKEWLPTLERGRAAAAALSLGDEPRVRLFVTAADEATGQRLREYFRERAAKDERVRHGGGGGLAFLDAPIDPTEAFATLQRFIGEAKK